jgi:hypothetical protein
MINYYIHKVKNMSVGKTVIHDVNNAYRPPITIDIACFLKKFCITTPTSRKRSLSGSFYIGKTMRGLELLTKREFEGKAFPLIGAAKQQITSSGVTGPQDPPRGGSAPYGERSDGKGFNSLQP